MGVLLRLPVSNTDTRVLDDGVASMDMCTCVKCDDTARPLHRSSAYFAERDAKSQEALLFNWRHGDYSIKFRRACRQQIYRVGLLPCILRNLVSGIPQQAKYLHGARREACNADCKVVKITGKHRVEDPCQGAECCTRCHEGGYASRVARSDNLEKC